VLEHAVEGLALDELHGEVRVALPLARVEDAHDPGVHELLVGVDLAQEALDLLLAGALVADEHDLHGRALVRRLVLAQVDRAHAPARDLAPDVPGADLPLPGRAAGGERGAGGPVGVHAAAAQDLVAAAGAGSGAEARGPRAEAAGRGRAEAAGRGRAE